MDIRGVGGSNLKRGPVSAHRGAPANHRGLHSVRALPEVQGRPLLATESAFERTPFRAVQSARVDLVMSVLSA